MIKYHNVKVHSSKRSLVKEGLPSPVLLTPAESSYRFK
jgi:hypothetical protein